MSAHEMRGRHRAFVFIDVATGKDKKVLEKLNVSKSFSKPKKCGAIRYFMYKEIRPHLMLLFLF